MRAILAAPADAAVMHRLSHGINGIAIDRDAVRMHGRDEGVKVDSYCNVVGFYYQFLKALTTAQP